MFWDDPKKQKKASLWCIGVVTTCLVIFLGIQNINKVAKSIAWFFDLLFPIILGGIFALIVNVPMCPIEKRLFKNNKKAQKLRRPLAIVFSLLIIFGLFSGVIVLVVPAFTEAVIVLGRSIVKAEDYIQNLANLEFWQNLPFGLNISDFHFNTDSLMNWVKDINLMGSTFNIIGTVGTSIVNFVIGLVFAIYILSSKEKLCRQICKVIRAWIPETVGNVTMHSAQIFAGTFKRFIAGQTVEAVILGSLCALGMIILRLPYAAMIGALVGVTALIPVVGAFAGTLIGGFMIFTISPIKALVFVIFLLILQQIEGNLIYPRVVGSSIGLPAIWVLAAVTIGGGLAGPVGMLLGVPLTSALYTLFKEATVWKESKNSLDKIEVTEAEE